MPRIMEARTRPLPSSVPTEPNSFELLSWEVTTGKKAKHLQSAERGMSILLGIRLRQRRSELDPQADFNEVFVE